MIPHLRCRQSPVGRDCRGEFSRLNAPKEKRARKRKRSPHSKILSAPRLLQKRFAGTLAAAGDCKAGSIRLSEYWPDSSVRLSEMHRLGIFGLAVYAALGRVWKASACRRRAALVSGVPVCILRCSSAGVSPQLPRNTESDRIGVKLNVRASVSWHVPGPKNPCSTGCLLGTNNVTNLKYKSQTGRRAEKKYDSRPVCPTAQHWN